MKTDFMKYMYFRLPIIVRLLLSIFIFMLFFGVLISIVEPKTFPTISDGIWWAFITGSTVGYGDHVPISLTGRFIAIVLILSGGGLIAFYITLLSAATIKHEHKLRTGKNIFKGNNHVVIIGWNARSKKLVDLIKNKHPKIDIILIDRTLERLPAYQHAIHFISGNASEDHTLQKANISEARAVCITADISKPERQADNDTILYTIAIRGNNPDIIIIAEMLTDFQVENVKRAGANSIVHSDMYLSAILFQELFDVEAAKPFEFILQLLSSNQFCQLTLPKAFENKSFLDVTNYYQQQNILLIGMIRDNQYKFNLEAEFTMEKDDYLLMLSQSS